VSLLDRVPSLQRRSKVSQAFKAVYETPEGKLILNHLLTHCGMLDSSYVSGAGDMTVFNEGKRFVGLEIAKRLGMDEAATIKMAREQQDAAIRRALETESED
jgi:hypothetical protein